MLGKYAHLGTNFDANSILNRCQCLSHFSMFSHFMINSIGQILAWLAFQTHQLFPWLTKTTERQSTDQHLKTKKVFFPSFRQRHVSKKIIGIFVDHASKCIQTSLQQLSKVTIQFGYFCNWRSLCPRQRLANEPEYLLHRSIRYKIICISETEFSVFVYAHFSKKMCYPSLDSFLVASSRIFICFLELVSRTAQYV